MRIMDLMTVLHLQTITLEPLEGEVERREDKDLGIHKKVLLIPTHHKRLAPCTTPKTATLRTNHLLLQLEVINVSKLGLKGFKTFACSYNENKLII